MSPNLTARTLAEFGLWSFILCLELYWLIVPVLALLYFFIIPYSRLYVGMTYGFDYFGGWIP